MAGSLREHESEEISEINVTPFIDVMLVLLIIFMMSAPLLTVDIPVDLPAATVQTPPRPDKPIYVTLKADSSLAVGDDPVTAATLASALDVATKLHRDTRLYLRADKAVAYGDVIKLFNELRGIGYLKVALVALEQGGSVPAQPEPRP